jgi:4-diphosphocytidyl-2-C-methyl-D-erythritol kinase
MCWIVLCTPPVKVSTAEMFAKYEPVGPTADDEKICNIFESLIHLPEVGGIKRIMLDSGAPKASMSGSGPTVFGIFECETQAKSAFENLYPTFPKTFLTTPV